MTEAKNTNYTPEMVEQLITMYEELGNDGIEQIAEALSKPIRSVRSKLVKEGVYVATPKSAKAKSNGPSKKELLRDIEALGFEVEGFEAATKVALTRLLGLVKN